ncbi:hypothetical protein GA0115260_102327, partial [Streptomyces sp. MnatMP-M27]
MRRLRPRASATKPAPTGQEEAVSAGVWWGGSVRIRRGPARRCVGGRRRG